MNHFKARDPALVLRETIEQVGRPSLRPLRSLFARGVVVSLTDGGDILVRPFNLRSRAAVRCDLLVTSAQPANLRVNDVVLMLCARSAGENSIVIGRVGRHAKATPSEGHAGDTNAGSKVIVIEADDELSLRCGESSIDLRKDGKVMIRGKDVLTYAKRTQRIKGGSVAIN